MTLIQTPNLLLEELHKEDIKGIKYPKSINKTFQTKNSDTKIKLCQTTLPI
jgi:hypothetical protein